MSAVIDNRVAQDRRRWLSLITLCTGFLMVVLDQTIVNVALPSIQSDLGFTQSSLAWVINAYLIPFGGLLLLAGRLGDLIGRRRVFLSGLVGFTVASAACGLATSSALLIAARFVQGACGAVTSAVVLGMIVTMFPEPKEQTRAIGVYTFVATAGAAIGLIAGGLLTEALNWHWIFVVNVPIGVATWIAASRLLESDRGTGLAEGADIIGAVMLVSSLMLAVYTIVEVPNHGWTALHTLGLGSVAAVLFVAFLTRQGRVTHPLVPLRIFRSRTLSGANAVQIFSVVGMFGMFFLGALYLQRVLGYGATDVGLAFLPTTVIMAVLSISITAKLIGRYGPSALLIGGMSLIVVGLALFSRVPVDGHYVEDILLPVIFLGIGAGLAYPSLMSIAMSEVDPSDSGLASGLVNTAAQVGGSIGVALLATLSTTKTDAELARAVELPQALVSGYQQALWLTAALACVAVLVSATVLRPRAQATTVETESSPEATVTDLQTS